MVRQTAPAVTGHEDGPYLDPGIGPPTGADAPRGSRNDENPMGKRYYGWASRR